LKGRSFLVDYVDGDTEDEFKWLEGPHSQKHTTIADLLDRRRSQSRKDRRRQGHTEYRCDEDLDLKDPHGKRLAAKKPKQSTNKGLSKLLEEYSEGKKATKKGLRKLLEEYPEDENEDNKLAINAKARKKYLERLEDFVEDFPPKDRARIKDILEGEATRRWNKEGKEIEKGKPTEEENVGKHSDKRRRVIQEGWSRYNKFLVGDSFEEQIGASPKRDIDYLSPKRNEDKRDGDQATLMVATKENQDAEPLHDLTYVGIDTCTQIHIV
jgi:hypothetical protein